MSIRTGKLLAAFLEWAFVTAVGLLVVWGIPVALMALLVHLVSEPGRLLRTVTNGVARVVYVIVLLWVGYGAPRELRS